MKTISMTTCLQGAVLCLGISSAWGAKPAQTIYVDASASAGGDGASWEKAFTDLQDALGAAASGDEIWVAAGTYKPTSSSDRSVSFMLKSGVSLYGGFTGDEKFLPERSKDPSLTVLSGDIGITDVETDNSIHVVSADGVTGAVLDGFTVTRGHGDVNSTGAGMNNTNSSLVVSNCIFSHNKVAVGTTPGMGVGRGGGMCNLGSAPVVINCTFSGNQAGNPAWLQTGGGGGIYNSGCYGSGFEEQRPVIIGCTFSDNVAASRGPSDAQFGGGGGGMHNTDGCSATIDRCTFVRNLGGCGGAIVNFTAMPVITNCIFDTNSLTYSDGYGGAIFNLGGAQILNCTFYQNGWRLMPAGYPPPLFRPNVMMGGAIADYRVGSTITNCIFSRNAVLGGGGAIYAAGGATPRGTMLMNCLFHENIQWYPNTGDPPVIDHVRGEINPFSAGNLYDIEPLMADPAAGDFHLGCVSPCIDAGYFGKQGNISWPFGLPDTDFDGDKRVADSDGDGTPDIDIGADEFIPNLPDLGAFLQALAEGGAIEPAVAELLLAYIDAAQAALEADDEPTAVRILNELIREVGSTLGDNATADLIEMKIRALIEEI